VPGVSFVLGVNLKALENSVKARYGAGIDAGEYLKKFIHVTLELPTECKVSGQDTSVILAYLAYLAPEMGLPDHIYTPLRQHIEIAARSNAISLRDIDKILSSIALASDEVLNHTQPNWVRLHVMVTLVITKHIRPDLYPQILNSTVSEKGLAAYFGATERVISEHLDGTPTGHHDRVVFWFYNMWLFIVQSSQFNEDHREQFQNSFLYFDSPHGLPMSVNKNWLDQFHYYTPS
jgi:hypothetical protein